MVAYVMPDSIVKVLEPAAEKKNSFDDINKKATKIGIFIWLLTDLLPTTVYRCCLSRVNNLCVQTKERGKKIIEKKEWQWIQILRW